MGTLNEKKCLLCGSERSLERHHIFGGANRKNSEEDGLVVWLCHNCHNEPPLGVHHNAETMKILHEIGQRVYENKHTRDEFMKRYGRNYI